MGTKCRVPEGGRNHAPALLPQRSVRSLLLEEQLGWRQQGQDPEACGVPHGAGPVRSLRRGPEVTLKEHRNILTEREDLRLQNRHGIKGKEKEGEKKAEEDEGAMDIEKSLPPLWEQKPLQNETGLYELYAVLTHKGRDADSGHYVAWTKQSEDNWLQYDDDVVRHYKDNDIKQLVGKGGADWHIAYLCFYRTKKPE